MPSTSKASQILHQANSEDESGPEDDEQREPVKILKEEAKFDEVTVWGHDRLPAVDDSFVKGIEEWIMFAAAVCICLHWHSGGSPLTFQIHTT
jgi:Ribonuclease H2 non-catalytic subunit (Ylr154p-like)